MIPLRPLSFGETLDGAFRTLRRHFVPLTATSLLPMVLAGGGAVAAFAGGAGLAGTGAGRAVLLGLGVLLLLACGPLFVLALGALTHQVSEGWIGAPVDIAAGLRAGARAWPRLLGALLLAMVAGWIASMVVMMPVSIALAVVMPAVAGGGETGAMLALAAVYLVSIPLSLGVNYLLLSSFACLPAVVVLEGLGPMEAVTRSHALAGGARMRTGGLLFVATIIAYLPMIVALVAGTLTGALVQPGAGVALLQGLALLVAWAAALPFLVAVAVLVYCDRRVRLEALDVAVAARALAPSAAPAPRP